MYFALSEDQELFRTSIRKYLASVGQTKTARSYMSGNQSVVKQVENGLAGLGIPAILISEQYGGAGLTLIDALPIFEELGRVVFPRGYAETIGFASPIFEHHGTSLHRKYLREIAGGKLKATLAWLEPSTLSYEQQHIGMTLQPNGSTYVLNGTKTLVPDSGETEVYIVPVKTVAGEVALVTIEKGEDVVVKRLDSSDETTGLTELSFNNVPVTAEQIIGQASNGWAILQQGLLSLNVAVCAELVGGSEAVVEMATEYANTREQFGQPIGRFQAIKHKLVDMKVELDLARSLTYYAAWAVATDQADKIEAVASAKAFVSEVAVQIAANNIQIHGGIGFTKEIDCHLYVKRAKSLENYLGAVNDYYEKIAEELEWRKDGVSEGAEVLQ